jgi:hypothetical protein
MRHSKIKSLKERSSQRNVVSADSWSFRNADNFDENDGAALSSLNAKNNQQTKIDSFFPSTPSDVLTNRFRDTNIGATPRYPNKHESHAPTSLKGVKNTTRMKVGKKPLININFNAALTNIRTPGPLNEPTSLQDKKTLRSIGKSLVNLFKPSVSFDHK